MPVERPDAIFHVVQSGALACHIGVETRPVVSHLEREPVATLVQLDRDGGRSLVPVGRSVLQRLEAAVVDGRLDLDRIPADLAGDLDPAGGAPRDVAERLGETVVGKQLRVDAVRDVSELVDRLVDLELEPGDATVELGGGRHALEQDELNPQREQPLLRPVMEVLLDPVPRDVVRGGDPRA